MKGYTSRLQMLEKHFCIKPIPTFEQFKTMWAEADALSKSVLAALAESMEHRTKSEPRENYMLAVRGYLLQMGVIDPDAKTLLQIAEEMEGNAFESDS